MTEPTVRALQLTAEQAAIVAGNTPATVAPGGLIATSPGQTDRVAAIVKRNNAAAEPVTDVVDVTTTDEPRYQVMPPLDPEDFAVLRESIKKEGILLPVVVDGNGNIIDGHHRAAIASELGWVGYPTVVRKGLTPAQKRSLAYTLNIARRQLTRAQVRGLIAESLKADPQLSDREHARRTGVSHPTVASVRGKLEEAGDVEKLSTRTDTAGREQAVSKPPAAPDVDEAPPESIVVEQPMPLTAEPDDDAEAAADTAAAPKKARLLTLDEKLRTNAQALASHMDMLAAEVEALFTEALDADMANEVEALFADPFQRLCDAMDGTNTTEEYEADR